MGGISAFLNVVMFLILFFVGSEKVDNKKLSLAMFGHEYPNTLATEKIAECEKNLPRTQHCVIEVTAKVATLEGNKPERLDINSN
jgi:hypothetical protein